MFDPTLVTQVSWRPRAFLYEGFLSEKECDHLINMAKDKLHKSLVTNNESGKAMLSKARTCSGMFFTKTQDEIISEIESRVATWTFLPRENDEPIQVLCYKHDQQYESHFDYFNDKFNQKIGGNRMATVLMYLSNVEKGGETVFPKSESWHLIFTVKPKKGDALLFFSLHLNATTDTRSLHRSCPVIEGEKWSATKWIHVGDLDKAYENQYRKDCDDEHENCSRWTKAGECEKNSLYMIGKGDMKGNCMKSCNVC
ncbi:putative procollagen-proline 4-dioxygenase [Lupinus albus]|uniref:procollagen-proline 4-dioxygenase n=1 Tax=Lupinus albus TaxID=3870 RepID=A0A6A4QVX6_LUPAL|nr:putative procollagen-proline 4-dioxygenase [Lupinus albus]